MKIGMVGFAGSGKSTAFHWLTGARPDPSKGQLGQLEVVKVPDERLDWLSARFNPKKTTPASVEFLDTPGLLLSERRDNARRLAIMRDAGGLLVVLAGFSGGSPAEELRRFREELLFADLEVVSNRISRLEDQLKKPRPAKQKEADQLELALLQRIAAAFEQGQGAGGFQEVRQGLGGAGQALHHVQGLDQALVEEREVAHGLAAVAGLDEEALGTGLFVEAEGRFPPRAGQHGRGQQGERPVTEHGRGLEPPVQALAQPVQAEPAAGQLLDVPRPGHVGLAPCWWLVVLGDAAQEGTAERVTGRRKSRMAGAAHGTWSPVRGQARW